MRIALANVSSLKAGLWETADYEYAVLRSSFGFLFCLLQLRRRSTVDERPPLTAGAERAGLT
jgi:hypothetical protein